MIKLAPGYQRAPDYRVDIELCPWPIGVQFGKTLMADSTNVLLMLETQQLPAYYFPRDDLTMQISRASELTTHCPSRGAGSCWYVNVGGTSIDNAG